MLAARDWTLKTFPLTERESTILEEIFARYVSPFVHAPSQALEAAIDEYHRQRVESLAGLFGAYIPDPTGQQNECLQTKSGRYAVLIDLESTRSAAPSQERRHISDPQRGRGRRTQSARSARSRDRLSPKTVTVAELLDRYLADREALGRGAKTLQEYRGCADRLIRPHLGGAALAKLRPARIAEWVAELLKRGGKPTKGADGKLHARPLSAKSVHHAFAFSMAPCASGFAWSLSAEILARQPRAPA